MIDSDTVLTVPVGAEGALEGRLRCQLETLGFHQALGLATTILDRRCVEAAHSVLSDEEAAPGYIHAGFAMTALPHKRTDAIEWVRDSADIRLRITGLGLSMIYGFAKQSDGQVRIHSELGRGTTVCLYLPRHQGDATEASPEAELADVPRAEAGQTVLVVDDEPTIRMLVTEILEDLGYTAIEAADGASGLKVLRSDARIDLLVTDVGLPGGLNGRQMADAARMVRPELKVLFITGYAENAVLNHGHLDPGMHVLIKPFAMEALAKQIKELISA